MEATHDEFSNIEDVLPSFEMHNYMFNRTIYDTENLSSLDLPPTYDSPGLSGTQTHETDSRNNRNVSDSELHEEAPPPGIDSVEDHVGIDSNNFVDPTKNPNLILLNNLEKFQKIDLSPLHIQIVLTKNLAKLGRQPVRENPLREYKPSEVVCGYLIIENKSSEPIPFEMLLVSLEGESTIPHPEHPEQLIKKKFLISYDLSACFHYGCIDLESQGVTAADANDTLDQSVIGFYHKKILPKTKHKKFFTFKLPKYLLDNTCFDQLVNHLQLPPSFGVNNEAFKGSAKYIKIDPFLGYGRLDRYGSPIRTIDYSLDGQSISYFINVQFIGRKLDFYKKFYTRETSHEYDFIFLKNIEYHFRVDTSDVVNEDVYNEISTAKQLSLIENLITDKLHEIVERKQLKQIGIEDLREQDEIIFSSQSNNSKKSRHLPSSSNNNPLLTDVKSPVADQHEDSFTRSKTVKISKDFFSKVDGDLEINISMHKLARLKSLKPKTLSMITPLPSVSSTGSLTSLTPKTSNDVHNHLKPSMSASDIVNNHFHFQPAPPPLLSQSSVDNLLTPTKSTEMYIQTQSVQQESVCVHLTFKPSEFKKKNALPNSISLTPMLKLYNIMSPYPIPINFDHKFLFDGGLDTNSLDLLKKKFSFYYHQLMDNLKELDSGLAKSLYNKINSISRLFVSSHTLKKIFEPQSIDLTNQWKFNENLNLYECEFNVPLIYDFKNNPNKLSTYFLTPSFQQCYLARLYAVDIDVTVKKTVTKSKISMLFPVSIN